MQIKELAQELSSTSYPGRGILLGKSADGLSAVIAYFIMGRSVNSRNRVFEETPDGIRTRAFDESKMEDPSLIIYHPVRVVDDVTIVTNGDQTDTIADALKSGKSFEEALRTRTFEPDAPNYTPRISGLVDPFKDTYRLSILKSLNGNPNSAQRLFFEYASVPAGLGHFVHTYQSDGNPLPSFDGEPTPVRLTGNIDEFTQTVWNSLNADNKVSLYVSFIDLKTGKTDTRIVNKNR